MVDPAQETEFGDIADRDRNAAADTAASAVQERERWRDQIETLAISVCRIKRLPNPDPETLRRLVSEAVGLLAMPDVKDSETLPVSVVAYVAGAFP